MIESPEQVKQKIADGFELYLRTDLFKVRGYLKKGETNLMFILRLPKS